jgi:hypothetical protein
VIGFLANGRFPKRAAALKVRGECESNALGRKEFRPMRLTAVSLSLTAVLAMASAPALAGPGCSGYKPAKTTYPATAMEPSAPQTPLPSKAGGG